MRFHTTISKTENGAHTIRGNDLIELIEKRSFAEIIFLLLRGDFPTPQEKELLEAVLVASVENGIEAPSLYVPRVSAASGNPFHAALGAGMLSIGEKHGGAAEKAAELLSSGKPIQDILSQEKVIPGFGHKIYKDEDPRTQALYQKAKTLGFSCKYFDLAFQIEKELENKKSLPAGRQGKKLPLNIDGAMACCMLELGFDPKLGKALFLISRIVGMSAHVLEEYQQGNSYYRLDEKDLAGKE